MLKIEKISNSVTFVSALDPELRIFDIIMKTEFGSTYNSYIVDGGDEIAIIDTAKEKYIEEYMKMLEEISGGNLEKIKYLIVNHTEPDHSGEIHDIIEKMPWLKIVGSGTALGFLKDISNKSFDSIEVKSDTKLRVGNKNLSFVIAPNLHWPDTIFTHLEEENILFTCDVFGAHYCSDKVFMDEIEEEEEDYWKAFKYYYECIFGPFKSYVLRGLRDVDRISPSIIAPSHGPVIRKDIGRQIEAYRHWSNEKPIVERDKIAIVYTSAYGYTGRIAEEIGREIENEGFRVSMVDLGGGGRRAEALSEINSSAAFLIGSPTLNADTVWPVWEVLLGLDPYQNNGKLAGSFGSFGWSGEAVRNIESRLSMIRCEVYRPGLRIKFNPNDEGKLEKARVFGRQFARKLLTMRSSDGEWAEIKTGKWKCLVCGEIFEGEYPPEICDVCGAPADQFIEMQDMENKFRSDEEVDVVVIGSGIAGVSAIEAIRERNLKAKIRMISAEEDLPYFRILLSKELGSNRNVDMRDEEWFSKMNVEKLFGRRVERVDYDEKKIYFKGGEEVISFEKLIIASGAIACRREILGDDKRGVFWLRSKKDFERISEFARLDKVHRVVVNGGGILGVEIASALKKMGKEVSIVEFSGHLMSRQLDRHASILLERHLEKNGIKSYLNECIGEIYGTGNDLMDVCRVHLKNSDSNIDCDMLVQATGIVCDIGFTEGLEKNKGIIVDSGMRTSRDGVFACGDVAEFEGKMIGLWSIALEQGRVAGANLLGDSLNYVLRPLATSFNGLGYNIFSIGDVGYEHPERMYQILELSDPEMEVYRKFYFLDNLFVGGILMGDTKKANQLRKAIDKGSTMQSFLDAHFLDE